MTDYIAHSLQQLKAAGLRVTQPRRLVVAALAEASHPLSAYELRDQLETDGEKADVVTVYRILECLEEQGLIHRLTGSGPNSGKVMRCQLGDESACEHHGHHHCHHVLVCQQCQRVEEVHCHGMEGVVAQVGTETGFAINHHTLEFTGVCPDCQKG
jgi:Fe2+ or Zn2+ uptake regulation protein